MPIWYEDIYKYSADSVGFLFNNNSQIMDGIFIDSTSTIGVYHDWTSGSSYKKQLVTSTLRFLQGLGSSVALGMKELNSTGMIDKAMDYLTNVTHTIDANNQTEYTQALENVTDILSKVSDTLINGHIVNDAELFKKFAGTTVDIRPPQLVKYFISDKSGVNIIEQVLQIINSNTFAGTRNTVQSQLASMGVNLTSSYKGVNAAVNWLLNGQFIQMPPHGFTYEINSSKLQKGTLKLVTNQLIFSNLVLKNMEIEFSKTCVTDVPPDQAEYASYDGKESGGKVREWLTYSSTSSSFKPLWIKLTLDFDWGKVPDSNTLNDILQAGPRFSGNMKDLMVTQSLKDYQRAQEQITMDKIKAAAEAEAQSVANTIVNDLVSSFNKSTLTVTDLFMAANTLATQVGNYYRNAVDKYSLSGITSEYSSYLTKIQEAADGASEVTEQTTTWIRSASEKFNKAIDSVMGAIDSVTETVNDAVSTVTDVVDSVTGVIEDVTNVVEAAFDKVQGVVNTVTEAVASVSNAVGTITSTIQNVSGRVKNLKTSIKSSIKSAKYTVKSVTRIPTELKESFKL